MEAKKDNWIEQTLNSADGLKRVSISSDLKKKLSGIPQQLAVFDKRIPLPTVWLAAASIAILFTLNILSVRRVKNQPTTEVSSIYSDYFSYTEITE